MKFSDLSKYIIWLILSVILIGTFFIGFFLSSIPSELIKIVLIIIGIIVFILQYLIIIKSSIGALILRKKLGAAIMHSFNLLFSFIIGFTIPLMESSSRNNFAIVMLPLLIILSLIITDKFFKDFKSSKYGNSKIDIDRKFDRPVIEFEGKKYIFSNGSLIALAVGAPLLALVIYYFFDWNFNYWLHEIVVKQTVYLLNLFFNMGSAASYFPFGNYHWSFIVPGQHSIYFETFCTGVQAICVFAGIIIFIPHSLDKETSKDIIWRKAKSLVISSFIFYVVNIIRMLIQIELYYLGYPWESIHVSISAASSFIAAIIIILMHKWIPEFIISIIYIGTLIKKKIGKSGKTKERNYNQLSKN
ncbi:MAG: archaeosortase H [Candidatus Odinarchaeota archaeon]